MEGGETEREIEGRGHLRQAELHALVVAFSSNTCESLCVSSGSGAGGLHTVRRQAQGKTQRWTHAR